MAHRNRRSLQSVVFVSMALSLATAQAGPREAVLDAYAQQAKREAPDFTGFDAARGQALHTRAWASGKADTPACTSCHGDDVRASGRTRTGKAIEPMAVSRSAERYTDAEKVEKWFKRNCTEVIGRACSAREKGDWLTYVMSR